MMKVNFILLNFFLINFKLIYYFCFVNSKPESVVGRKVRVICEVFGEGKYIGIGRNKRLAKSTAAKKALRDLKIKQDI